MKQSTTRLSDPNLTRFNRYFTIFLKIRGKTRRTIAISLQFLQCFHPDMHIDAIELLDAYKYIVVELTIVSYDRIGSKLSLNQYYRPW